MASVGGRGDAGLLERDGELGLIGALVERARGGEGSLLVVEGQAGVGKTELLRAAGELGGAEGLRVLRTRGSELDSAFAFGVVRQLLEREVADDPELLTGGAEPAAAVFAAVGGDTRAEEGVFSSLQGLRWLVVNLAARGPLLLLADDVHWADTASLRWLVFLAERVEDVRALIVAATRPAEPGADQELLDALMVAPAARVLRPAPLSAGATTTVVRGRLPDAVDAFSAACLKRLAATRSYLANCSTNWRRMVSRAQRTMLARCSSSGPSGWAALCGGDCAGCRRSRHLSRARLRCLVRAPR